jgi:hypothetical protein
MQALVYSRVLPSGHRFFRSASSCSELVTTKLAVSYPNIICVDLHGVKCQLPRQTKPGFF